MGTRLCNCGNCETFVDRGFKLAEQMLLDGECPSVLTAVACTISSIAVQLVGGLVEQELAEKGLTFLPNYTRIVEEAANRVCHDTDRLLEKFMIDNATPHLEMLNNMIERVNAATRAKQEFEEKNKEG